VFVNGFWWGLYPWDYYPYYGYGYPSDYYNGYPYDYSGYPYDYYNGYYPNDYYQDSYDNDSTNAAPDQYASNPTVSAVQSKLGNLGYYHGAIDGVVGDETQAALARYQEDHDLSVTGTVTAATLQSLGLPPAVS
jgi:putative peptidoglycan binding protein